MFAKLLKHEFRATRSGMGVLCGTAIALGILGGLSWQLNSADVNVTLKGLLAVALMGCIFGIMICAVGAMAVLLVQFYRSHFTDQAYLTFTLPVSTHAQLLASLLNMVLNLLLIGLSVILAYGLLFLTYLVIERPGFWSVAAAEMPGMMRELIRAFQSPKAGEVLGNLALGGLTALTTGLNQLLQVITAMTLGALIAKKHKVLTAVAVYYAAQIGEGLLAGRILIAFAETPAGVLWIGTGLAAATAVICYFLTHYLITRKLNLP